MKKLLILLLIGSLSAFAGLVEFGAHAGVFSPVGSVLDYYKTSPIFGVNILAHMPMLAIEGSVSYAPISTEEITGVTEHSESVIPILAGIRSYSGPIFYGGGLSLDLISIDMVREGSETDEMNSRMGAYGNVGMIFPIGGMDIEASLKYHLMDFDFDTSWFGLTAGINF